MAKAFHLSVVSPDRSVVEEEVNSVILPGAQGYFGILGGHVPFAAALRPGLVEYIDTNLQRTFVAIGGGFATVTPHGVDVLADTAERATEIDIAEAEAALEKARAVLRGEEGSMTVEEATTEIERAMNRIQAARR
jgi:F-type H+-transporting ATPase subunit epsilon